MSKINPYQHRTKRYDKVLRQLQKELKKHNFPKSYWNPPFRFFKHTTLSDIVVLALQIRLKREVLKNEKLCD